MYNTRPTPTQAVYSNTDDAILQCKILKIHVREMALSIDNVINHGLRTCNVVSDSPSARTYTCCLCGVVMRTCRKKLSSASFVETNECECTTDYCAYGIAVLQINTAL